MKMLAIYVKKLIFSRSIKQGSKQIKIIDELIMDNFENLLENKINIVNKKKSDQKVLSL